MGKYSKVPRKNFFLIFFTSLKTWYLFTRSQFEMGKKSQFGILTSYTLRIFCSVAAPTKTQSTQADLRAWDRLQNHVHLWRNVCINVSTSRQWEEGSYSGGFISTDFAGINALKLQGQIKYKSKFRQWRMENSGLFFLISWKQDLWIMDPLSALVKPVEFLPQTSRDFWLGLGKIAYLIFNVSCWLEFMAEEIII